MPNTHLQDVVDRVRLYANEPATNSKFSNAQLMKHIINPAFQHVYNDVFMAQDAPVQLEFDITLRKDTRFYQLPTNLRSVNRLIRFNTNLDVIEDWKPHGERESWGPGWQINGHTLELLPKFYLSSQAWKILYSPNCDFNIHSGTSTTYTTSTITLDSTPTLGELDLRSNAYVGSMIRIIEADEVHENYITDYDPTTRIATLRFTQALSDSSVTYEVCPPPASPAFYDAVAMRATLRLWGIKRGTTKEYEHTVLEYRGARKTLRDQLQFVQNRDPLHFNRDTWDNREENGRFLLWPL